MKYAKLATLPATIFLMSAAVGQAGVISTFSSTCSNQPNCASYTLTQLGDNGFSVYFSISGSGTSSGSATLDVQLLTDGPVRQGIMFLDANAPAPVDGTGDPRFGNSGGQISFGFDIYNRVPTLPGVCVWGYYARICSEAVYITLGQPSTTSLYLYYTARNDLQLSLETMKVRLYEMDGVTPVVFLPEPNQFLPVSFALLLLGGWRARAFFRSSPAR